MFGGYFSNSSALKERKLVHKQLNGLSLYFFISLFLFFFVLDKSETYHALSEINVMQIMR